MPGPKAFLAATVLLRIASEGGLPAAIFEIESVLLS
jgi:hypothetical protein